MAYFLILRSIRKQGGFTMFGVAFHAHPKPRFKSSFIGIPKAIREATRQQDNDWDIRKAKRQDSNFQE